MCMRLLAGAVLLFSSFLTARSEAGPAEDRAAADALFKEGRELLQKGDYAEACPKFAASQRLDPTPGTLLTLGDCYERNGQTASAWATFNEAGALAGRVNDERRAAEAARRAGLLEPKLSKLVVDVAPEGRVARLEVRRNGKPIDEVTLGAAIPVDPGTQRIEASAPGKQAWSTSVTVEAKPDVTTVRIPSLADVPAKAPLPSRPPAASGGADRAARSWSTRRTVGVVLGGAGLAGVVVGTVFGVRAFSKAKEAEGHCGDGDSLQCDLPGRTSRQEGAAAANVSNVAFAAGGAALAAGVVVFVTAPVEKAKKSGGLSLEFAPAVGMGTAGLSLRGEW